MKTLTSQSVYSFENCADLAARLSLLSSVTAALTACLIAL